MFLSKSNNNTKILLLLFGLATVTIAFALFIKGHNNFDITSILQEAGYMNPPKWLVYTLMGVTSASAILAILSGAGIFFVPMWAAEMLAGATGAAQ